MEEKKTTPNNADQNTDAEAQEAPKAEKGSSLFSMGSLSSMLSEKEQKSLLFYIAVGIILVEFAVTVGALITGIAGAEQLGGGKVQFNFPWTGYLVTVVVAPIIVILLVNLIGMGFYRAVHGEPAMSSEQFDQMPEKARNFFSLVRGAPTIILFGGIVVLGAVLYYLDGVMSLLLKLGDSVETIVIWGTCGIVIAWCLSYCARMWLMYRTRRLEEDYAFRREVLERTGMVILDGKNMLGSQEGTQYIVERALPSGGQGSAVVDMDALPTAEGTTPKAEAVQPAAHIATPEAEKDIVDAEIIEPEVKVVEPEPVVAEAEPVVAEPEPVKVPKVVEAVEVVKIEVVAEAPKEPEAVEPELVEAEPLISEAEASEQAAEIVHDSKEYEPQTLAIVHIAVQAIFDAKEMVSVAEEPAPAAALEVAPDTVTGPVVMEPEPIQEVIAEAVESELIPELTPELVPEPASESTPEVKAEAPAASTDVPVTKPNTPQSPQAPKTPSVTAPKPPVRRARLSDEQKRRH